MRKWIVLLFIPLFLTSCAEKQQEETILEITEQVTESKTELQIETIFPVYDNPEDAPEGEPTVYHAVMYQGTVYYGILLGVKELNSSLDQPDFPENAVLLGRTDFGSEYDSPRYMHTLSPSEELQTNWTSPDKEIYAVFDADGVPTEFYSIHMDENRVVGNEIRLAYLTTEKPDYYDSPEI